MLGLLAKGTTHFVEFSHNDSLKQMQFFLNNNLKLISLSLFKLDLLRNSVNVKNNCNLNQFTFSWNFI